MEFNRGKRGGQNYRRGRGGHSRGQGRGGDSPGHFQQQNTGGHPQEPERGTYFRAQPQPQQLETGGPQQQEGHERGSRPQERGRGNHRGRARGAPFGSQRSAPREELVSTQLEPVAPSTSAQTVEQLQKLSIEPRDEVSVPNSAETKESKADATQEQAGGSKKKKQRKKKGQAPAGDEPTTSVPTEGAAQLPSAVEPKPSTSAEGAGAVGRSTTEIPASKTGATKPVDSAYDDIPKRQKQGPIYAASKYFSQKTSMIEVNYLPIEFSNKNMKIYHYDVEFPKNANKEISIALINEMKKKHYPRRHPAFDGKKNLYAANTPLFDGPSRTGTIKITKSGGKEVEFTVTIKRAAENVELTIASLFRYMERNGCSANRPQSTIQAIEVAIRGSLPDRFANCGRSFYTQPQQRVELSAGLELYSGFMQGAVLGQKPFLNVDVSHRGFYTAQSLLDYVDKVIQSSPRNEQVNYNQFENGLTQYVYETLDAYVKQNGGLKMRYEDPRTKSIRTYRMKCAGRNAKEAFFPLTEGDKVRKISVFDYFRTTKGYTIRYPKLPVIEAGNKGDFFPLECCSVDVRQPVQNSYRYSGDETRGMIANCKDLPERRKQKILSSIRTANFNNDPILKEFSVTIGERGCTDRFLQVPAASLLTPEVLYSDGYGAVKNGVWFPKKFIMTYKVTHWVIVNMNRFTKDFEIDKLEVLLIENAMKLGLQMARASQRLVWSRSDEAGIEQSFKDLKLKKPDLQLAVIILPSSNTDIVYRRIKYVSEIKIGLLTQCVKPNTVQRVSYMTAQNILLKVNSKLDGVNHIMHYPGRNGAVFDGTTMFVGADVNHPAPGSNQDTERSICAVAGSYNEHGTNYKMLYSIQKSREEMILGMEKMIQTLLLFFSKKNGKYPTKMFYYRDGVSDGQFTAVLNTEMTAIKSACRKLGADVRVTFLVVQKRHHTRFFPSREFADKKGNVFAGTVVNTTITHPTEHDFYLVSHESIQGTARPTKYHVLYDEIRAPEDYVEALTYYLCYTFVRCTRSVSYPAPTYYAHKAAERAEKYVKCVKDKNTVSLDRDLVAGALGEGTIHNDMRDRNPMYFV